MSKKTIIIFISIYVISLIFTFFFTKNLTLKQCKDSETKLEEDLNKTNSKMADIEKRNDELLGYVDLLEKDKNDLTNELSNMTSDINQIKSSQQSAKKHLDELDNSVNESTSTIQLLKENVRILQKYFQETSDILGD